MGCGWRALRNLIASSHKCPTAKDGQQEQMVKNVRWKQRWEGNVWFWRGEILALVAAGSSQAGGCTLHEELYFPGG